MLFSSKPLAPKSSCNCRDTVTTICLPYSARSFPRISRLMRSPICQYMRVSSVLTLAATRLRASLMIWRRSLTSGVRLGVGKGLMLFSSMRMIVFFLFAKIQKFGRCDGVECNFLSGDFLPTHSHWDVNMV